MCRCRYPRKKNMESAHTRKARYPDVHEAHSSSVKRTHTVNNLSIFNRRIDRQWCGSHMVVLASKKGHWHMQDHGQLSNHSSEWKSDKWGCVLCHSFMGCYTMQAHLQWQKAHLWLCGQERSLRCRAKPSMVISVYTISTVVRISQVSAHINVIKLYTGNICSLSNISRVQSFKCCHRALLRP